MDALATNLDLSPTTIVPLDRLDLDLAAPAVAPYDVPVTTGGEDAGLSAGQRPAETDQCDHNSASTKKRRPTVSDLLRRYGPAYLEKHGHELPDYVTRVLTTLSCCRTPEMGGHKWRCQNCQHVHYSYNSCHSRYCPTCGDKRRDAWFENVMSWLLPIRYYHAVFTLDHRLCPLILANARTLYRQLFNSAKRALLELAEDTANGVGLKLGLVMVLHTWGQAMLCHPHIHILIPAGGFRVGDGSWVTIDSDEFFLEKGKLADTYRDIYCKALRRKHRAGELEFPGELARLADEETFLKWLAPIANRRWHIHTCQPEHVHRPGAALEYLSRYVVGSAISDVRIVSDIDGEVTIGIKDYRNDGERKTLSMPGEEFVRRLALHILPPRFTRARYGGWLGNRNRTVNLKAARAALNVVPRKAEEPPVTEVDLEELLSDKLGDTTFRCPKCGEARLLWEGEIQGTMGWQRQRSQMPPKARARKAQGTLEKQLTFESIRSPPD